MNAKRLTIGLIAAILILSVAILGSAYLVGANLKSKSQALASAKGKVAALTTQESGIAKSKHDIAAYTQLEGITKAIVPQDKDQAAAVREITNIAAASDVPLTTITFPSSTLGSLPGGKPIAVGAAASAALNAKPNLSQLTLVPGLAGVYRLQITLSNNSNNTVNYTQLTNFLRGLESNRRTAAVSSINIDPQAAHPDQLVFTLIINTYIKP